MSVVADIDAPSDTTGISPMSRPPRDGCLNWARWHTLNNLVSSIPRNDALDAFEKTFGLSRPYLSALLATFRHDTPPWRM
jgi:hypothetical protein